MTVPAEHGKRYVYHFSHIDNLPGLLKNGFLANNHPKFPRRHRSIAASGIQERRATMTVPCSPGGCVHDYVPFYFGSVSPMLLSVLRTKNVDQCDLLYFEFPITLADRPDAVFTDASANTATAPQFFSDTAQLSQLDWAAIDSLKWSSPDDAHRHRRMAEVLVHKHVALTDAARCVVLDEKAKKRVKAMIQGAPFPPIELECRTRRHWFRNMELKDGSTLVIGPKETAARYEAACNTVIGHPRVRPATAKFPDLHALLIGLRKNFACLPQTAELVGLQSENGFHKQPVDEHTKDVVKRLMALPEFDKLGEKQKNLVEIAAYLHDIGKGPRSRWDKNNGLQKVDTNHPVGAMPMMVDILTQHVAMIESSSARTLLKMVCYHDLVGDVLGKGRDECQIVKAIDDEDELKMLFALGKADAASLREGLWDPNEADQLYGRCLSAIRRSE